MIPTPTQRRLAASLLALALSLPATALADVVSPPPLLCPPGRVGRTSHAGPACVKVAPDDCPPGWRGLEGGTCQLMPCASDEQCPANHACIEHITCLRPFEDHYYDYGEEEREKPAASVPTRLLLAEPPPLRKQRPKPITRYDAVNLCSAEVACAAPSSCQAEKLCAPRGARALAYRGDNISPARVGRKTDLPLPAGGPAAPAPSASASASAPVPVPPASSTPPATPPLEGTAPARGGCAGCAVGGSAGGGLAALVLLLVMGWRREKRRRPSI